jgi:hypothetical protein
MEMKKLLMGTAIAAFTLGTLAATAGMASAAPTAGRQFDEGNFNLTTCYTGLQCTSYNLYLGPNHIATDAFGFQSSWHYSGITHVLTVSYIATGQGCAVYTAVGGAEKGFNGTIGGCGSTGTMSLYEPLGV